ncbi:hypothetical protein LCGC14_2780000, partial [marine sediment metagenome]
MEIMILDMVLQIGLTHRKQIIGQT